MLRFAMAEFLPDRVLNRKKSPYPKTHDPAYFEAVSTLLKQLLQDKNAPIFHIINRGTLENLLTDEQPWPWYGQLMKTPQTIAYMLQINAWLEQYHIRVI